MTVTSWARMGVGRFRKQVPSRHPGIGFVLDVVGVVEGRVGWMVTLVYRAEALASWQGSAASVADAKAAAEEEHALRREQADELRNVLVAVAMIQSLTRDWEYTFCIMCKNRLPDVLHTHAIKHKTSVTCSPPCTVARWR